MPTRQELLNSFGRVFGRVAEAGGDRRANQDREMIESLHAREPLFQLERITRYSDPLDLIFNRAKVNPLVQNGFVVEGVSRDRAQRIIDLAGRIGFHQLRMIGREAKMRAYVPSMEVPIEVYDLQLTYEPQTV